jgi:hypothetical protein
MLQSAFMPAFKRSILNMIKQSLFAPTRKDFVQRQNAICLAHQKTSEKRQTSFLFKGEIYSYTEQGFHRPLERLSDELTETQQALLDEIKQFTQQEESLICAYLTNALNLCNTPNDLLEVLPEQVHSIFKSKIEHHLNHFEVTVPPHKLTAFKTRHQLHEDILKQRLMMNILLR